MGNFAVFGDSLMGGETRTWLSHFLAQKGHTIARDHHFAGTNWCDWMDGQYPEHIYHGQPFVIAAFSGNMLTPCTQGRGTAQEVYQADADAFAATQAYLGRTTWLMSTPGRAETPESANWTRPILQAIAAKYAPLVRYVDAGRALAVNGVYKTWVAPCDSIDIFCGHCYLGIAVQYQDDLAHLRPAGSRRWAQTMAYVT